MHIFARIKSGIKYKPLLCRKLETFDLENFREEDLLSYSSFVLKIDKGNDIAVSWWVSPKRTRSYPYARVYDTIGFSGKRITIIPVVKDEGKEGDRDFLQWDTISLMSLLGVYVIIAYYTDAEKSTRYRNKITNQRFDIEYIKKRIMEVTCYHSDALHWNLAEVDKAGEIGQKALEAYSRISERLGVEMHSWKTAENRICNLLKGKDVFMLTSRKLAEEAQNREEKTVQPKENLSGTKAKITIDNYLGGRYYFTADEAKIYEDKIFLIEGKHSRNNSLPSLEDIKDGLLKMILFANLEDVNFNGKTYQSTAVLKLTSRNYFDKEMLSSPQKECLEILHKEAETNNFLLRIE